MKNCDNRSNILELFSCNSKGKKQTKIYPIFMKNSCNMRCFWINKIKDDNVVHLL